MSFIKIKRESVASWYVEREEKGGGGRREERVEGRLDRLTGVQESRVGRTGDRNNHGRRKERKERLSLGSLRVKFKKIKI
jgi:hypothetical protein